MPNAGKYRHPVTVYKQSTSATPNAAGHVDLTDDDNRTVHCKRWVEIEPTSGRETVRGSQVRADATHIVRTREDDKTRTITPKMWLVHDSRRLEIITAYNVRERDVEVEMQCREVK